MGMLLIERAALLCFTLKTRSYRFQQIHARISSQTTNERLY